MTPARAIAAATILVSLAAEVGSQTRISNQQIGNGGQVGYLTSDGSNPPEWGNIITGGSGALDCVTIPGQCDIVPEVVPLKGSSNVWTGANDFSSSPFLRVPTIVGVPQDGCSTPGDVGKICVRSDAQQPRASVYFCTQTGVGEYSWEQY